MLRMMLPTNRRVLIQIIINKKVLWQIYPVFTMRQKTNLCVLFLGILHFTVCKISFFFSSNHFPTDPLAYLKYDLLTFLLHTNIFYGFHYSMFVLSREISRPPAWPWHCEHFVCFSKLRSTSPAVHYRMWHPVLLCTHLCWGKHHERERGALNVY